MIKKIVLTTFVVGGMLFCQGGLAQHRSNFLEPGIKKFLSVDEATVAAVKRWQETGRARPIVSDDGVVLYPYGQYQAKVVCSPLRVCDIALQPGEEVIDNPSSGDDVRWSITKATSGSGPTARTHVVVKPKDVGLQTNLIVRTDKRIYHILLVSRTEGEYVNQVGFYYPTEVSNEWKSQSAERRRLADQTVSTLAVDLNNIDTKYTINGGTEETRPVRVFNDGKKTYIQMRENMDDRSWDVAALILRTADGQKQLTNYRIKGNFYIVDRLFERAELLLGADGVESKVEIIRNKDTGWFGNLFSSGGSASHLNDDPRN